MKKKFIFAIGILLFFGFVTVNCSAQASTNDQRIVGTWVNGNDTYVFNANGSGTITSSGQTTNFTYGLSINGEIRLIVDGQGSDNPKIYFSPDGKMLIINTIVLRKK